MSIFFYQLKNILMKIEKIILLYRKYGKINKGGFGMREKIMIDMDDVITKGGFLYLLNQYLHTNYQEEDFTGFYMQDILPDKKAFFDWFFNQNLYDYCKLLPNAYEVLEKLNKEYDIYIGTAYLFREEPEKCGIILQQKFDYLKDHLPFIHPSQYIFLTDKSLLNCDIKIDDRIKNLKNAKRKLLFTAYHNQSLSKEDLDKQNVERVNDWKDIEKILIKR